MWIKRKKERRECWFRPYTLILWAWPNRIISPERLVYRSLFIWHGKLNRILCVCVYSLNIKNIHIHYQRLVLNWLIKYKTVAPVRQEGLCSVNGGFIIVESRFLWTAFLCCLHFLPPSLDTHWWKGGWVGKEERRGPPEGFLPQGAGEQVSHQVLLSRSEQLWVKACKGPLWGAAAWRH